jgi:hypothetical protein
VRLHSPGGSLAAGIPLGALLRQYRMPTEVGRTTGQVDRHSIRQADREPGTCASACAYVLLGGEARTLEPEARFGLHRFYRGVALKDMGARQFTGVDLDTTQRVLAGLVLYVLRMGTDARTVGLADRAGPDDIYWISQNEAKELKTAYDPKAWEPWKLEPYKGGLVAFSRTMDASAQMSISCSRSLGPQLLLTVKDWDMELAKQHRNCALDGVHPVLGTKISTKDISASALQSKGVVLRFRIPSNVPLTDSALFSDSSYYANACIANLTGSTEELAETGRLALRNCFQ